MAEMRANVSVSFPLKVAIAIDEYCEHTGKTRSAFVQECVTRYLEDAAKVAAEKPQKGR